MLDRARGALWGLAIGDALGMPTQSLPRSTIVSTWGPLLTGFEPGPDFQPIAPGLPAGTVTDDTEQAVLLARELIAGAGHVDPARFASALATWEDGMRARGSLDLLGPSTRAAIAALRAGVPVEEAGRSGTTNGAAMRITPIGIAVPLEPDPGHPAPGPPSPGGSLPGKGGLMALVDAVVEASRPTHNTQVALAGASAVAAAVSVGVGGGTLSAALGTAVRAAELGGRHGAWAASADVAARIRWVLDQGFDLDDVIRLVGTGLATAESVPAAFAVLALTPDDPWLACRRAASLGGDTDTIAAMTGAVAGACLGVDAFPRHAVETVRRQNDLDLDQVAQMLVALRFH